MKIARIIYAYSPYSFGGTDIFAEKTSRALDKRNNETIIITISPDKCERIESEGKTKIYRIRPLNITTVHNVGKKNLFIQGIWTILDLYGLYSYNKVKSILKIEKPDVVHMHTPVDFTLSAVHAVKSLNLPLVYTLHDFYLLCRRCILLHGSGEQCTESNIKTVCKIYREFTKRVIKNVDLIIAPSRFVLDYHKKYGFFEKTKTVVLPHGIELEKMEIKKREDDGNINFLYVGALLKHKGVDILIKAFKQIKIEIIRLHLVGEGVCEQELKSLAVDDKRIFFHGKLSHESVQAFYRKADVVVFPSICCETRGNVIAEAFRAGLPVIASDIGGIPETVQDNYNGFLFGPGKVQQLKEIILSVTDNPEKLKILSQNALTSAKQYEMTEYINKLTHIYNEAIEINKAQNNEFVN